MKSVCMIPRFWGLVVFPALPDVQLSVKPCWQSCNIHQVKIIRRKHNWTLLLSSCAGYCILRAAVQNIWGDHRHCSGQLFGQVRSSYKGVRHYGPH